MKTLIKISLLLTGMLTAAVALNAQTTPSTAPANPAPAAAPGTDVTPAPAHPGMFFRRAALRHYIVKQLGLSSDQIAQIKTIRTNTRTTVQSIKADTSLPSDQQKARIHETMEAARQQMRAVLTPDQQAKLDQMRQNARHAFDF